MSSVATRRYEVAARSTDVFGRVLWSCRDQHFVADGPVHNGCPGEAVTPAELFLAGVAACGVELLEVIAKNEEIPLRSASVDIAGELDHAVFLADKIAALGGSVKINPSMPKAVRSAKQMLQENIAAAQVELTEDDLHEIEYAQLEAQGHRY